MPNKKAACTLYPTLLIGDGRGCLFYMYPDGRISLRKKPDDDVVQPATKIPIRDQLLDGNCESQKVKLDVKIVTT